MKQFYPSQTLFVNEIEIKRSRFITYIAHTPDTDSALQFLDQIRELHPKANHNCWAQIAGSRTDLNCWGSNDDGEPKGTAGKPMLNVLEHSELCEICVVVTRYFGGIKLGAGGLVRAYSQAVQEAVQKLPITERIEQKPFTLTLPHTLVGPLEHLLAKSEVSILQRHWEEELTVEGEGSDQQLSQLREGLTPYRHQTHYDDKKERW